MCFEVRRAQADCQVTTAATFRETAYVRSAKRLEQARGKPPPATERWALHWAVGRGRSFEQQPTNRAFLKLLPLFRQSNIAHLLGFKLQYFQDAEVVKAGTRAPASLYQLAATLVASGWVRIP